VRIYFIQFRLINTIKYREPSQLGIIKF